MLRPSLQYPVGYPSQSAGQLLSTDAANQHGIPATINWIWKEWYKLKYRPVQMACQQRMHAKGGSYSVALKSSTLRLSFLTHLCRANKV